MQIQLITDRRELAELAEQWDRLPRACPMHSPQWLLAWWDVYGGERRQLSVIAVRDASGVLVGLAPWYAEDGPTGPCLRWLGDGPACSDHPSILCASGCVEPVVDAIVEWALRVSGDLWRQLRLEHVNMDEATVSRFVEGLAANGCPVSVHEEPGSCYIELPDSWQKFLALVSKNHRKRCRRWERDYFDTGRAVVTVSSTAGECRATWHDLVALHDARWRCLGKVGVFEDTAFRAFHELAIPALASTQQCSLRTLLFDGEPVAAEYVLQDESTLFAYQSGMSARGELESPGNLSIMAMIRDAIAAGRSRVDLLRGAESYKFSWAAQRCPAQTFVIRRPSVTGHVGAWCDATWQTMKRAKKMLPVRAN